jgi:hypothetical protein
VECYEASAIYEWQSGVTAEDGQRTELLHRLQPSTRHTLLQQLQQLQQLQTCLTLMTTIQQTPPAITLHPPANSPAPTPTLM